MDNQLHVDLLHHFGRAQMYNLGVSFGTSDWSVLCDHAYFLGVRGSFERLTSSSSAGQPA